MDIAIVTGAASGIGLAIAQRLVDLGMRVYGLGGNYKETPYSHEYFVPTPCDLADPSEITEITEKILEKEGNIFLLVNNAKVYPSTPFLDKTSLPDLEKVFRVNLLCPIILTRLALPSLVRLQGFIVNIVPSAADQAKGGPAGAAAAGGLRWLGQSLFEECRETGVKVTSIFPQANLAQYQEPGSVPEKKPHSMIDVEALADAVESVVKNPHGNIITELVIRPQRLREKPVPPPLDLPFPPVKSIHQPYRPATISDMEKTRAAIQRKAKKTAVKKKSASTQTATDRKAPAKKAHRTESPHKGAVKKAPRETLEKSGRKTEPVLKKSPATARKRHAKAIDNDKRKRPTVTAKPAEKMTTQAKAPPARGKRPPRKTTPSKVQSKSKTITKIKKDKDSPPPQKPAPVLKKAKRNR